MQPASESAAGNCPPLNAALRDYQRYPGKYAVARKEPAILFDSMRAVLQIAAGKSKGAGEADLQPAACFFVRTALMHPGADHYTQLGLPRNADAATVKEHYRLLMRLVHPDFSATSRSTWPGDAATRINLAYEVLASREKRIRYDETLTPPSAPQTGAPSAERQGGACESRSDTATRAGETPRGRLWHRRGARRRGNARRRGWGPRKLDTEAGGLHRAVLAVGGRAPARAASAVAAARSSRPARSPVHTCHVRRCIDSRCSPATRSIRTRRRHAASPCGCIDSAVGGHGSARPGPTTPTAHHRRAEAERRRYPGRSATAACHAFATGGERARGSAVEPVGP